MMSASPQTFLVQLFRPGVNKDSIEKSMLGFVDEVHLFLVVNVICSMAIEDYQISSTVFHSNVLLLCEIDADNAFS